MYLRLSEYLRPSSVEESLRLIGGETTALLAGGTHLNVYGHEHLTRVVDLQHLSLGGITLAEGQQSQTIGTLVTLQTLARAELPAELAALQQAARAERNRAIRNRTTVGGRLARDRSDARIATALVALGAEVEVVRLEGHEVVHHVQPVEAFLVRDADARRRQLLAEVRVPLGGGFSHYAHFGLTAMSAPYADVALRVTDGVVRLASGGHGPGSAHTLRLGTAEGVVASIGVGDASGTWQAALREAVVADVPAYTDVYASGAYRRELAVALTTRLVEAWLAAQGVK